MSVYCPHNSVSENRQRVISQNFSSRKFLKLKICTYELSLSLVEVTEEVVGEKTVKGKEYKCYCLWQRLERYRVIWVDERAKFLKQETV